MPTEELPQVSRHHIEDSVILVGMRIFLIAFIIDTLFALIILVITTTDLGVTYSLTSFIALWVLQTLKFIVQISLILKIVVDALTSRHYLTDTELISYKGALHPDEKVYDLEKLWNIEVEQSWLGRLLNYGDLHLLLASSGYHEDVYVRGIANPRKYERLLREHFKLTSSSNTASPAEEEEGDRTSKAR